MNKDNLININDLSEEQRREQGRKGGLASVESRKEKRKFKELLELALSTQVTNSRTGEKATRKEVAAITLADKCAKGDLKAIRLVAALTGEMINKQEVTGKDGKDLISGLSSEEIDGRIQELLTKMKDGDEI